MLRAQGDPTGNQTSRIVGGVTYKLTYEYENRLTSVSGGSISASFVYDASGSRVKGTVNGITTVYVAGVYEYQNGATTLYYEGGAMRRTGTSATTASSITSKTNSNSPVVCPIRTVRSTARPTTSIPMVVNVAPALVR